MKKEMIIGTIALVFLALLVGIVVVRDRQNDTRVAVTPTPTKSSNLANPASQNCIDKGGSLTIQTLPDGGQYGLCTFEDNLQCEEWALFRGECPVGGLNVIGYDNKQQVYCAITGGKTLAVKNATCTLPDGTVCPVDAYYDQTCPTTSTDRP